MRKLNEEGYVNLVLKTRDELDLLSQQAVQEFFETEGPEYVFLAAAKVGGILANKERKAEFIYENLQIQNNIILNAWKTGAKKLLFLGSSCIYPKLCPQPIKEEYFMTGPLEETNDAYAVAKIAGIKMCQSFHDQYGVNFISAMPTNLYGPGDNFDLKTSHVLPALIRKFHEAKVSGEKKVVLWGTGSPMREFLHVDDLAKALVFLMEHYDDPSIINIGTGEDLAIRDLASEIAAVVGFNGTIEWDSSKPDGTPRKLLNVDKIRSLGWVPSISLREGIASTYQWYLNSQNKS